MASAAISGSLDARDYNMDAYIPLQTLRQRVGDSLADHCTGVIFGLYPARKAAMMNPVDALQHE